MHNVAGRSSAFVADYLGYGVISAYHEYLSAGEGLIVDERHEQAAVTHRAQMGAATIQVELPWACRNSVCFPSRSGSEIDNKHALIWVDPRCLKEIAINSYGTVVVKSGSSYLESVDLRSDVFSQLFSPQPPVTRCRQYHWSLYIRVGQAAVSPQCQSCQSTRLPRVAPLGASVLCSKIGGTLPRNVGNVFQWVCITSSSNQDPRR